MLKSFTPLLFGLAAVFAANAVHAGEFLPNTNFGGNDIQRIPDVDMTTQRCDQLCEGNPRCKAWTMVKDGSQGGVNVCYLKDPVPARAASNCCDSGIKHQLAANPNARVPAGQTGAPGTRPAQPFQRGYDRPGNDYRHVEDFAAAPEACAQICNQERGNVCQAWVYVRPTPQDGPHCYLKNRVTLPVPNACCDTGVGNPQNPG